MHRPIANRSKFSRVLTPLLLGLTVSSTQAQPLRLVVIGDSMSAEYDSISGFAGVDDPTEYAAITVAGWESMSWVEVLGRLRSDAVDLGGYKSDLLGWGVLRFSGYEYNFAVPGFTASQFEQVVNSSILSDPQLLPYKLELAGVLQDHADAAVVWLGANEFRANYGFLYEGNDPTPLINELREDLAEVLDFVRAEKPGIKLVIVNLPDLGAAPDKQAEHPDPLKRANVTAATVLANQAITNLALARGLPVADAFADTYQLIAGEPVWIGPVNLFPGTHPDNHPRYQFTRDGLHPNACLQAIVARTIVNTFNQAYATALAPIKDAEILNLIRINPLQIYFDWAATNTLVQAAIGDDPDDDGWVNLAEFVFASDPNSVGTGPLTLDTSGASAVVRYAPDLDRQRLVEVQPDWSGNLSDWLPVPAGAISVATSGEVTITLPAGDPARFIRLRLSVRPVN